MSLLCSLPLIAGLFAGCTPAPTLATGYVEGDYSRVAPVEVAQIGTLKVTRGARVAAGTVLVEMETKDAEIALAMAVANVAQAQGALDNLQEGARPEEIRVIEATLASAQSQADEAKRALTRVTELAKRGVATPTERDNADTALQMAEAQVAQVSAELTVARLPARPQAIAQAKANLQAAEAARDQAAWRLDQRALSLPEPVTVTDIIRHEGEIAGPSAPVLTVLPDGAVKLRLYIPETRYAEIAVGSLLAVRCDSCADGIEARVSYVSDAPEFTPPVIYSLENRQKLVYLIEARPTVENTLKPGQIVDVALIGDAK